MGFAKCLVVMGRKKSSPVGALDVGRFSPEQLRRRAVRQTTATVSGQLAQAGITLGATMVLARVLSPEDFGLVAMVAVVVQFVAVFRDLGFTEAVVQKEDLTLAHLGVVFYASVVAAFGFALLTAVSAPVLAALYGEPRVVGLTMVFAGVVLFTGLSTVPQAIFARQLRLGRVMAGEVLGTALGAASAIGVGLTTGSYWALAVMPSVRAIFVSTYLWIAVPYWPGSPKRDRSAGSLLRFGRDLTGFRLVNFFARNGDNVLIGWRWGPDGLGPYAAAYRILMLPLAQLSAPITRVMTPVLVRLRSDPIRYRRTTTRAIGGLVSITAPAMVIIAVQAESVVGLLLGDGWDASVDILRWLAVAAVVQPVANATGWLFLTQGRTGSMFRLGLMSSGLSVLSFLIGLPFGAIGVAIAYTLVDVLIRTPMAVIWAGRSGPVSAVDILRSLGLAAQLGAVALALSIGVRLLAPNLGPAAELAMTGAVCLAGVSIVLASTERGRMTIRGIGAARRDILGR